MVGKRKIRTEKPFESTELPQRATAARTMHDRSVGRVRDIRLGFLIHDLARMRKSVFDKYANRLGVTHAQWWVLANLARHDGMMQTQLASLLEVGKVSLGELINRLVGSGLVERRADALDGRVKRVYLTRKSQNLLVELREIVAEFNGDVLSDVSEAERDELVRLLSKVKLNLLRLDQAESIGDEPGELSA